MLRVHLEVGGVLRPRQSSGGPDTPPRHTRRPRAGRLQSGLLPAPPGLRGPSLVAGQLSELRGVLGLRHGMVVESLGLEEDGDVPHVSPEVGDGVAAVAPTRLGLQHPGTARVGTRLAELLPPRLITYCWSDGHLVMQIFNIKTKRI